MLAAVSSLVAPGAVILTLPGAAREGGGCRCGDIMVSGYRI